jgi:catechol 2,3-dioxygenase-like lactoylglutathione lyase family enzyme
MPEPVSAPAKTALRRDFLAGRSGIHSGTGCGRRSNLSGRPAVHPTCARFGPHRTKETTISEECLASLPREEPIMFASTKAYSGFAVDDLQKAGEFYGETLGLTTSEEYGLMWLHLAGDRDTLVYQRPDHTPATYTILNFPVDDIDQAVDELAARGVSFESYVGVEQEEKAIFRGEGPHIGWFKDPAGNVLSVLQEK